MHNQRLSLNETLNQRCGGKSLGLTLLEESCFLSDEEIILILKTLTPEEKKQAIEILTGSFIHYSNTTIH